MIIQKLIIQKLIIQKLIIQNRLKADNSKIKTQNSKFSMLCFKLFHAVNQRLHALKRLSVVAAGTEAANRAVALDADHTLGCGKLEERLLKLSILVVHDEADVHDRTVFLQACPWLQRHPWPSANAGSQEPSR